MKDKDLEKYVKSKLDQKRYDHTIRVVNKSKQLAKIYNAPIDKVKIGAYLHDIAKYDKVEKILKLIKDKYPEVKDEMYHNSQLLHGFAAAEIVQNELKINDKEILEAIAYHTIGKENMSMVAKIVYLSDAIEDKRDWLGVIKARKLAESNINTAIIYEINKKMEYLIKKNSLIHPNTLAFRNDLLNKLKREN